MLRASWDGRAAGAWRFHAALTAQRLQFLEFDPVLGVQRGDRYRGLDISLTRDLVKGLELRLEAARARYRSTAAALQNDWLSYGAALQFRF
jgi:hypothetical protein